MPWPAFPSIALQPDEVGRLFSALASGRLMFGPRPGSDGSCRLQPLPEIPAHPGAAQPFLSLKKFLVPDGDPLWAWTSERYAGPPPPPRLTVVDLPLCDLQALAWLDLVFAEDPPYRARREALLVVGAPCQPAADCFCDPAGLLPGGDLFRAGTRWWALSPVGEALLVRAAGPGNLAGEPLPGPEPGGAVPTVDPARFAGSAGDPLWDEAAARCLACGACSAVCPTCMCYEVVDDPRLDGTVTRRRVWDNCFFPEHARVAGGHDFRPGRGRRLRFRFEHKYLGFGPWRGLSSCVGCGRCRRACPVGISLEEVAGRLARGAGP